MKGFLLLIGLVLTATALAGCVYQKLDFVMLTSESIDVSELQRGEMVTADDCSIVFLIPWGFPDATVAMNRALEKGQGDILLDVEISRKFKYWVLGATDCEEVTGTIARTASYKGSTR